MCIVTFESWSYLPWQQFFRLDNPPYDLSKFTQNEQWHLEFIECDDYKSCPANATDSNCNAGVYYKFFLKRKSAFYNCLFQFTYLLFFVANFCFVFTRSECYCTCYNHQHHRGGHFHAAHGRCQQNPHFLHLFTFLYDFPNQHQQCVATKFRQSS